MILKIFLVGWVVLMVAIVINGVTNKIGIESWYPFMERVGREGFLSALVKTSPLSKLFLFILYPMLLGLTAYFGSKYFK